MPIDFPTVKLADPAAVAVTVPAATDTVQGRTTVGGDRNFLLGNLAGLATLTPAADQSAYYNGTTWATYSLTAAGRDLLAATDVPAQRVMLGLGSIATEAAASFVRQTELTVGDNLATDTTTLSSWGVASIDGGIATATAMSRYSNKPVFTSIQGGDVLDIAARLRPNAATGYLTLRIRFDGPSVSNVTVTIQSITSPTVGVFADYLGTVTVPAGATTARLQTESSAEGISISLQNPRIFRRTPYERALGASMVDLTTNQTIGGTKSFVASVLPSVTNVPNLGSATLRFASVFLVNAPNVSSDARLKTEPRQLRDAEFKAASAIARLPAVWRWIHRVEGDENCEPEGREARKHFGPTVQAAIAVMEAHGLDPFAYSFICYDQWEAEEEQWHEWPATDAVLDDDGNVLEPAVEAGRELVQAARAAGDRYSFRKEELLCFLVAAMARQHDELDARVTALEAKLTA